MFFYDGEGNRETESASAAGALRGEKWVEDFSHIFRRNAGAVVLDCYMNILANEGERDLNRAVVAAGRDGLFRVHHDVPKNLGEQLPVSFDRWKIIWRCEFYVDVLCAQRRLLELQGFPDDFVKAKLRKPPRWRAGKGEQILDDVRGAARLFQDQLHLPARGAVRGALTQQITYAEDGRERIIELVGHACNHVPHRGKLFVLGKLLLELFRFRDVLAG